ncbi:MAG: NF038122 family metalloprotease [Phormidesmis sp.]
MGASYRTSLNQEPLYAEADATTSADGEAATVDEQALESLQNGNTADFVVNGEVIDGNSEILLTSAQAKALGMDQAITLENGTTWDRDLIDTDGLDGYILVGNQYEWSYDYTRADDAPEGTLDFLSMAMHEIGHTLGFFSGLDGSLDTVDLHSGETQVEDFSVLDLYRHSLNSSGIDNPDGAVSDLTVGENSYFSLNGGVTNLANFSTGITGDGYQASHWKRLEQALGILDPTLAYQERLSVSELDLQAFDVLGYDINYGALDSELDLEALLAQAEATAAEDLGIDSTVLSDNRGNGANGDRYSLSYSEWWSVLESHILDLGYGELFQLFEIGYGKLFQQHEAQYGSDTEGRLFELGYGQLFQAFEETIFELGYGELFQAFEADLLELGYGNLFQIFELGYGKLFQTLEPLFATLDYVENAGTLIEAPSTIDFSGIPLFRGGENDDIIGGSEAQDRVDGGLGDDLIDGKAGDDLLMGNAGRDLIYGADGDDIAYGGDDDDRILGEAGNDQLFGDDGHDIIAGGFGHDILSGGDGRDDIEGASGNDVIAGGSGDDVVAGGNNSDLLMGEAGADTLRGGAGNDIIYGDQTLAGSQSALSALQQHLIQAAIVNGDSDNSVSISEALADVDGVLRIEAEDMLLSDAYITGSAGNASGGRLIRNWDNETGHANAVFTGSSGQYMVVVHYLDESDGQADASFSLNGNEIDSWQFNQDNNRFVNRTVATNITLNQGDVIELTGTGDGEEYVQFDYIDFIALEDIFSASEPEAEVASEPAPVSLLTNSGFESGLDSWSVYDGNVGISAGDAYAGNQALSLTSQGANAGQNIEVTGGEAYTVSSFAQSNGDGWDGFGIAFLDANWQTIDSYSQQVSGSDWQLYKQHIVAPDAARYANIWTYKGGSSGTFSLDELSVYGGLEMLGDTSALAESEYSHNSPSENLLVNSSFASGLASWDINAGGAQVTQNSAYDGQHSLRLDADGSSASQVLDVTAGLRYQVGAAGKSNSSDWSGYGVDFWDVNWQRISTNTFEIESNSWRTYQHEVIAPEGAFHASIWGLKTGANGVLSLDNFSFKSLGQATSLDSGYTVRPDVVAAQWTFDEASGNVASGSLWQGDGLLLNMEAEDRVAGVRGNALRFDGVDESVRVDDQYALRLGNNNTEFSVSLWLNPETGPTGEFRTILQKWSNQGRQFGIWLDEDSNLLKYSISTTVDSNLGSFSQTEIGINEWTHIALVKRGNQISLYLNGEFDSGMTVTGMMQAPEGLLELGAGVQGAIDEVNLYNRALNILEIQSLSDYNADVLEGGIGDDQLFGNEGDDILEGSDRFNLGRGERDVLSGGSGRDRFILGNEVAAYYSENGVQDYATLTDFDTNADTIQLHGSSGQYSQQQVDGNTQLIYNGDLVAVLENIEGLNLNSNSVSFVS